MKSVKVSIQDENTLVLLEDGSKGDVIDLKSLHETDIDKSSIANIVNAIERGEFEKELAERTKTAEQLAEARTKNELSDDISKLNAEIVRLKAEKDGEVSNLKNQLDNADTAKELAITKAVGEVKEELTKVSAELASKDKEAENALLQLKDRFTGELQLKDEQIAQYKDFKAKLSVKLVGENLEQHCQNEFNSVRAGQFPFAYFEKDNEAIKEDDEVKGTKGDFIYKDYESQGGAEIISVMFEMKDEQDVSANKRTVESHLEKLDKDRKKKGLEYAVLVTLLEADNDLYNRGIVDMSYKYEKMYVIRPQFFLPLITLLKNANMKSAEDKRQLIAARNSNIDIENFVGNMEDFKEKWGTNMRNAAKKHVEGVEQINKAIKDLEKARDALMMSDKHLLTAENRMDDLTVKRLTKNAPSVAARFEELKDQ
ncbi:MAG TPA: DUF2130 domain-containing protein [Candidatus Saccharibacteria bacterium]|mgnify:FL=1|nr:DUF2130 domain-containing protein [Candidatus Saccharibacteria bacterium]